VAVHSSVENRLWLLFDAGTVTDRNLDPMGRFEVLDRGTGQMAGVPLCERSVYVCEDVTASDGDRSVVVQTEPSPINESMRSLGEVPCSAFPFAGSANRRDEYAE